MGGSFLIKIIDGQGVYQSVTKTNTKRFLCDRGCVFAVVGTAYPLLKPPIKTPPQPSPKGEGVRIEFWGSSIPRPQTRGVAPGHKKRCLSHVLGI